MLANCEEAGGGRGGHTDDGMELRHVGDHPHEVAARQREGDTRPYEPVFPSNTTLEPQRNTWIEVGKREDARLLRALGRREPCNEHKPQCDDEDEEDRKHRSHGVCSLLSSLSASSLDSSPSCFVSASLRDRRKRTVHGNRNRVTVTVARCDAYHVILLHHSAQNLRYRNSPAGSAFPRPASHGQRKKAACTRNRHLPGPLYTLSCLVPCFFWVSQPQTETFQEAFPASDR